MAGQPIVGSLAQLLDLPDGYVVEWLAIDATTGANVAGVQVGQVSLFGTAIGLGGGNLTLATGQPILIRQAS